VFNFSNGFYDAADSITTVVSIRGCSPPRGSDPMLRRVLLALSVFAFIAAPISGVQAAPPGAATPIGSSQPLSYTQWNDPYYLNHPLNADRSIQAARFLRLRDTKLLFPATSTLFDFDFDGSVSDQVSWVDRNISPNREYIFVTDQRVLHDYTPPLPDHWAKWTHMYCVRENLATHQTAATRCNFADKLTRLEYKECDPQVSCNYYNPWGTRNHSAISVTEAWFENSLHDIPDWSAEQSVRARNPCMRARFLNPFSNPAWQSLHLSNWYKGTTGVVNVIDHNDQFYNVDTIGMHATSSSERSACEAG
jgi:hypothetical protein